MGIAGIMRHKATIERDIAEGTDPYGNPLPPDYQVVGIDVPCRVWTERLRRNENDTTTIYDRQLMGAFLIDADVQNGDRLTTIYDPCGNVIHEGVFIDGAPTNRYRYLEVQLTEYK